MSWRCRPITWSPMSGRPGFSAGSLACCMRRSAAGSPIRCRRCGCSTPISLSGSGRGWPGRCWRGSWGTGGLSWPGPRCRPAVRSSAGAAARFAVPAETAAGLRALARENGVTMFMTLFAAYAVLLGRYAGLEDVVAGTPVANRNSAETEGLIGFFVNTLVLRADLAGDPPFTELLGRVRAMALGAYAHQDLPFEQLVDALVTDRDRSRTPLFQVFFAYARQGRGGGRPRLGGAEITGTGIPRVTALFDLSLTLADAGEGGLAGGIEYSTALFDHATVQRAAGHLAVLLGAVAADPGARVPDLVLVTAAERREPSGWAWNGARAWSRRCWRYGRPAAGTCRWIRGTRRRGWRSCWPTAARGCWWVTAGWPGPWPAGRRRGPGRDLAGRPGGRPGWRRCGWMTRGRRRRSGGARSRPGRPGRGRPGARGWRGGSPPRGRPGRAGGRGAAP